MNSKQQDKDLPLIIYGAGGHGISVASLAQSCGYQVKYFIDSENTGHLANIPIVSSLHEINDLIPLNIFIAIGDNAARESIYKSIKEQNRDVHFPSLISPTAAIGILTKLEEGVTVMSNSVIGPRAKIGKFCVINTLSCVSHDCTMKDFSSVAIGGMMAGGSSIGFRTSVGMNASIKEKITIENDCIIGANSFVNKNLRSNVIAYGSPAISVSHQENPQDNAP